MFDDIHHQDDIEKCIFLLFDICQFEMQSFILSGPGKLNGLWRDVIAPEGALMLHTLLQLMQDFSCSASYFTDRFRRYMLALEHAHNLLCFPGRFFHMPGWIFFKIRAVNIYFFANSCWCILIHEKVPIL